MVHPIQLGKNQRMSYARIDEVLEMPNLIEVQKNSYNWFLEEGLKEVLRDISPITDYTGNLILEFIDYKLETNRIKYSVEECKERDTNYAAPLKAKVRLINKETGEVKEQEIFMGDFPLMTEQGTFIINGAERVIVSQLVRSPGIYYAMEHDKTGKELFSSTVIPYRGAWLEYENDVSDVLSVRIDRTRKIPITVLIRALGVETDGEILDLFGESEALLNTLDKSSSIQSSDDALIEIYKKLRPGEPPTVESSKSLLFGLLFDGKRYDLAGVGRYKFNKKLAISARIANQVAKEPVVNPETGEIMVDAGQFISKSLAEEIEAAGVNRVILDVNGNACTVVINKVEK